MKGVVEQISQYHHIRKVTEELCEPLETEDFVLQNSSDVSPPKWHLGHTSWFFENFILKNKGFEAFSSCYDAIFNSYYKSQGAHWVQGERGQLSRPTVAETFEYRRHVDEKMDSVLKGDVDEKTRKLIEVGLHHEQQHQELLLMDIKYNFSISPLNLSFAQDLFKTSEAVKLKYLSFDSGLFEIGSDSEDFCYDNERPAHKVFIEPFALANRLSTCGEYAEFIEAGGYKNFEFWHSEGWDWVNKTGAQSPMYWRKSDAGHWEVFGLYGWKPLDPQQPVAHLNYYEASAFAQFFQKRLPREQEWEVASQKVEAISDGLFLDQKIFAPNTSVRREQNDFYDLFGGLWEWTQSSYSCYPGYQKPAGAMGEYNSKFMCGQYVLRGGCFATPRSHFRPTYRNFFYPEKSWMFSGVRLAEDL